MLTFVALSKIISFLLTKHILNNMIKKLLFPALVGAMTMFASCEADPCKDLDGKCGTGTCFEGACVCDEGYEADASGVCNVTWPTKFLGDYLGSDNCTSTNPTFNGVANLTQVCKIETVTGSLTQVRITNLGGWESIVLADIKRANPSDESPLNLEFVGYTDAAGDKWDGVLTYNPSTKKLTGTYTLVDIATSGNTTTTCTIDYTKQ
jgi:hypothetical protein